MRYQIAEPCGKHNQDAYVARLIPYHVRGPRFEVGDFWLRCKRDCASCKRPRAAAIGLCFGSQLDLQESYIFSREETGELFTPQNALRSCTSHMDAESQSMILQFEFASTISELQWHGGRGDEDKVRIPGDALTAITLLRSQPVNS